MFDFNGCSGRVCGDFTGLGGVFLPSLVSLLDIIMNFWQEVLMLNHI